jgi:opacity protein-like surface antigen
MSRTFLKFVISLFVVIGFVTASYAQEDANMPRPNTKAGSAAWIFEIAGLGNFGLSGFSIDNNFGTGGVPAAGWKWYFADDMALRVLLGFSTHGEGADTLSSGHTSTLLFGIAAGVEMHTHPVYSTSPYIGAQVSFGTGSSTNTIKTGTTSSVETKNSGTSFGIGVLAGFDWYFTRGIAIGGEYMLGFSSMSSSRTTTPTPGTATTIDSPSSTTIGISNAGNVHLVVHF